MQNSKHLVIPYKFIAHHLSFANWIGIHTAKRGFSYAFARVRAHRPNALRMST